MGWPFLARRKGFEPLRSSALCALLRNFYPLRSKNAPRFKVRGSMPFADIQKSRHPMRGIGILSNLYTKDARLSSHYTAFFYAIFTTKKELLSLYSIKRANRATQKTYDLLHASPAKTSSMSQSSKREQILDASIRNRCI